MAKKRKPLDLFPELEPEFDDDELIDDAYDEDDDETDDDEYDDSSTADRALFSISEAYIADICGTANARRGLALFLRGAVDKRSFDGHAIRAQVSADSGVADASYDFDELEYQCSSPADGRGSDHGCAHVAALQYAWLRQPQSFDFANLGAALELYTRQPHLFDGSGLGPAFLAPIAALWESAPPALRNSISQLSVQGTPEQQAQLEAQLEAFSGQARDQEFADLLGRFTLEQLRAIAKGRHWILRATAKAKAIAELIDKLRASPLPDTFSPEEEQLVRIENTLWGIEGIPSHQNLLADWQAHAGGNRARFEHALQGLQHAGVLFPCTGENMGLHYHWSPFIRADMLPLLQPNVALSPAQRAQQTPLPLLPLLDALVIFAEREPLRLALREADPRLAGNTLIGSWPYVPEEVKGLVEPRGVRLPVPAALTVPFRPYFADETLDALGALAGGLREYGAWAAAMLLQAGVIQPAPAGGRPYALDEVSQLRGSLEAASPGPLGSAGSPASPEVPKTGEPKGRGVPAGGTVRTAADRIRPAEQDIAFGADLHATVVDPARASAWRVLPPDQQFELLWKLWSDGASTFGDFRVALQDTEFIVRRSLYDAQLTPQALAAEMGLARQFVARVLAMLSPQTWYAWPAFAAYIKKLRSGFLYTYTGPEQWWIEHAPSAKRYAVYTPQQWDAAWLPLLQAMLMGPLQWFGAIEFAGGQDASNVQRRGAESGELSAFRITPLGAWLFTEGRQGHVPAFAAAVAGEGPLFAWLDETTFRARATPDAMRALAPLRIYAEPLRELLTFGVSMPAIGCALAQGAAAPSIVEAFAAAGLPLAAAVQERISTLVARTGRLNLYERVTVLELGDDIALRELLATTALRAHIVHEFSPRLLVMRDEAVEALLAELVKKGHTPLLT